MLTFLSGFFNGLHHKKKFLKFPDLGLGLQGKYLGKELKPKRFVPFINKIVGHIKTKKYLPAFFLALFICL